MNLKDAPNPPAELFPHPRRVKTLLRAAASGEAGAADARFEADSFDVLALHEALEKLTQLNERQGRIVELRFLCALTVDETAATLEVSCSTVEADWGMARVWLRQRLRSA